jgi:hypothetical protein
VEEGHLFTTRVPFFTGTTRAYHTLGTQCLTERRYTMVDLVVPELAKAIYEERIRDAEKAHRFSSYRRPGGLLAVLRSLLPYFIRS